MGFISQKIIEICVMDKGLFPKTKNSPTQQLRHIQGHLWSFQYCGSHYRDFWLMYAQVGDFRISRGPSTVPLTRISRNSVLFKSQNPHKAGTLYILEVLIGLTLQNSNPFISSNLRIKLVELLITCCTFFRLD